MENGYKSIALRVEDYERVRAVKNAFEEDFSRRVSWNEFFLSLSTGYMMARHVMENEDKMLIETDPERMSV